MSYTKINKEIEKYLRANGLPLSYSSADSKEDIERYRMGYEQGWDFVFQKWISEGKYAELISVVHQGWVAYDSDFTTQLAEHLVESGELDWLRWLCEKDIRFEIGAKMLWLMKSHAEDIQTWDEVPGIEVTRRVSGGIVTYYMNPEPSSPYCSDVVKSRYDALCKLDLYLGYLERIERADGLGLYKSVKEIRKKVTDLTIRKKDLSAIKYRPEK